MNWNLIKTVAEIAFMFGVIRFILILIKKLFNRDAIESSIDEMGKGVSKANGQLTDYLVNKAKERREKKEAEKPVITIR